MSDERRMQVTGIIEAPPERIFALLADPQQHTAIDGAGMLRGLESGPSPVTGGRRCPHHEYEPGRHRRLPDAQ